MILLQGTKCSAPPPPPPGGMWPLGLEVGFQESVTWGGGATCMVSHALSLGSEDLIEVSSLVSCS